MNSAFSTPPVVKHIIIANCVMLLATSLLPFSDKLYEYLALFNPESPFFRSYQVVTYMFLHADLSHLFFNMFALWMFGRVLEYQLSSPRFVTYYLICGIGAALLQLLVGWFEYSSAVEQLGMQTARYLLQVPTVGASGAVFGLLLAFGVLHPNAPIYLMFFPVPIKAKWFVMIYGAIELLLGMSGRQPGVAHYAHLGGMLWGYLLLWWWRRQGVIRY